MRLEEAAMVEVKKEQEHQKDVLRAGYYFARCRDTFLGYIDVGDGCCYVRD